MIKLDLEDLGLGGTEDPADSYSELSSSPDKSSRLEVSVSESTESSWMNWLKEDTPLRRKKARINASEASLKSKSASSLRNNDKHKGIFLTAMFNDIKERTTIQT